MNLLFVLASPKPQPASSCLLLSALSVIAGVYHSFTSGMNCSGRAVGKLFWLLLAKKTCVCVFYTPEGEIMAFWVVMFPCVNAISLFPASLLQAKVAHILQHF